MPLPAHISDLEEHWQMCHANAQVVRIGGKAFRQTGHLIIVHPEHGPIKADLESGQITEHNG